MNTRAVRSLLGLALLVEVVVFIYIGQFYRALPIDNDNLALGLPARFLVSSAARAGEFPLWDPYSGAGSSFLSVYMPTGLSPIVWLLSIFGTYDFNAFVAEIVVINALAVTGMYLWLRSRCAQWISVVGALAYGLNPYMIIQSQLNLEAVGTAAAIPWICLGLFRIAQRKTVGIPVTASGLGLAFTSGYLGLNILVFELLAAGGLIWLILIFIQSPKAYLAHRRLHTKMLGKSLVYALCSVLIFIGMIGLIIAETASNLDVGFFTNRSLDPYEASVRLEALTTFLDTNAVNVFTPGPFDGHMVIFFLPTVMLVGLFIGFYRPTPLFFASILTALLVFSCTLSSQYFLARILVFLVPGLDRIRFHSWLSILIVFLLLTAASEGLRLSQSQIFSKRRIIEFGSGVTFAITAIYLLMMTSGVQLWYAVIVLGLATLASTVILAKLANPIARTQQLTLIFCLILIAAGQMSLVNFRLENPWLNNRTEADTQAIVQVVEHAVVEFPIPKDTRDIEATGTPINNHYFTKTPTVITYMPQRTATASALILGGQAQLLSPYVIGLDRKAVPYSVQSLKPNSFEVALGAPEGARTLVLTVPFSPHWQGESGGQALAVQRSTEGLIEVRVGPSTQEVTLVYRPLYQWPLLILSVASWLIAIGWVTAAVVQHLRKDRVGLLLR